ncbi:hypothetical protein ACMD2_02584 [Ananas comosus]|uniref:Virilizer N-terminal domain-containing protein n=1 Tax=Ananas comosus TaxID=4615 RepID=A0A199V7H5_ANACO|nr:hypothetical protein ACMD2_02584 [Ananas comosus]
MGRPEPYVLFAQTILHSQLDEYVDEVIFAEPVVITACEFLEQNASPSTPSISLIGATSPPSFALEVFVHCEGESRFRRLCQPFLYSHSSSNVLEVEAIVTNHLVLRGSYRSLTLVVYGNTAEDLGQFNIEVDLDNSLTNVVCSPSEGRLEDLPLALHSSELAFEESVSSLKSLGFRSPEFDILPEVKQFLLLAFQICQLVDTNDMASNVVSAVESVASSCAVVNTDSALHSWDQELLSALVGSKRDSPKFLNVLADARNELLEIWKNLQSENGSCELMEDELETQLPTTEMLVDMFYQCFPFFRKASTLDLPFFSQSKNLVFALGLILLVCSSREGCSHFVSGGGMDQIIHLLHREIPKSTATTLLLLLIIECATRHGIGCESFLGWWPRRDFVVPFRVSDGYCYLLELLLEKQRDDIASLSTYVLHRLRFFEILSRYESAVVFLLTNLPADGQLATDGVTSLVDANSQLKHILKSINSYGPIEDPSPRFVRRISNLGNTEDLLSYKATVNFIATSKYSFARSDFDPYLLSLLKERGFFPLSAALLSSATLRSASGSAADSFLEIATSLELILLSFLFCRSGLSFLLVQPEATELLILAFQDGEDISKTECMTLRQATVLLSKGFFCRPQEVGMIIELYLRVVTAVSRLLAAAPNSDEFLWALWELCAISRTDTGRKALLALGYFPEALSVLLEALRSYKDLEQTAITSGASPLSSAILHSAAEIFEVMVADSAASSLKSWIGLAVELHKALHLSSPGSNRQDAPTRLLKWIDAGVIYHKNGTIGLLQYAAILASGGDAHLSSSSILVSDSIDVENVFGDSTSSSDGLVIDNLLGKLVSDKYFDGVPLTSTSIVQLTTALRILAYISEDSAVAATLFEEGAVTLVYVVLVNCKSMLERWSNSYDYLVDEGAESSSTTDLLFGRSHEKRLLDLIIPSLETKEQYRNKKLLNALLQLHREVSPRLAACAADLSFLYPSPALGHGAICHLITSAVASWPIFGWAPGLFHSLLENIQATSSAALGPKDVCSLLSLLGYLFPDEGIWLWKNEMPPLSAVRALSIATVLGPQVERQINWYLLPEHSSLLLIRLTPQLDKIAQGLVVIQDMLRVLIARIASQRAECAVVLLRPTISWLDNHVDESSLSDTDIFKVHQLLHFIASLLEHPNSTALLSKMGTVRILGKVLEICSNAFYSEGKLTRESRGSSRNNILLSWSLPAFKSLALIFNAQSSPKQIAVHDEFLNENISLEESSLIVRHLLKLCQVLPVGKELLACAMAFKELVSSKQGRISLSVIYSQALGPNQELEQDERDTDENYSNEYSWLQSLPFLKCWKKLLRSLDSNDSCANFVVETVYVLSLSAVCLSLEGDSVEGINILKYLFGLPCEPGGAADISDEKLNEVVNLLKTLEGNIAENENSTAIVGKSALDHVKESLKAVSLLLHSTSDSLSNSQLAVCTESLETPSNAIRSIVMTSQLMPSLSTLPLNEEAALFFSNAWKFIGDSEKTSNDFPNGEFLEKFVWECSDSSLGKHLLPAQSAKRRLPPGDGSSKRTRDAAGSEATTSNVFSRGVNAQNAPLGPTRRDTFRQRKPNTSRPPSMHVDDYVARERNIDGASSGSNIVNTNQRGGSISGRPPSIHVDEFMARQRERQNSIPTLAAGDASQPKSSDLLNNNGPPKPDQPQKLRADLDDDEIDIVFDEEPGSDDKLPFPQPEENLPSPTVAVVKSSPGSVVEESEGDRNGNVRFNQIGSTPQASRSQISTTQELSVPSEKNTSLRDRSESNYSSQPSTNIAGFPSPFSNARSSAPLPLQQFSSSYLYQGKSPQKEQTLGNAQPPLPPTPPPAAVVSSPFVNTSRDVQPPLPTGYPLQAFDVGGPNNVAGLQLQSENMLSTGNGSWNSITGSRMHLPPLPPPPYSNPITHSPALHSGSPASLYNPSTSNVGTLTLPTPSLISDTGLGILPASGNNNLSAYSLPPFTPSLLINRPNSLPGSVFSPQQGQIPSNLSHILPNSQPSSIQPRPPPPPPPPPQLPHPSQTPQQATPIQMPQPHAEQAMPFAQSSVQLQVPLQFQQQLHVPQMQFYYPTQQLESVLPQPSQPAVEHQQPQNQGLQVDSLSQQQKDAGISLQQYFSSPEAIQSLLSDREKLCQLLEQHPKLMQMLQERLGQI